jgi:hypothetical protein
VKTSSVDYSSPFKLKKEMEVKSRDIVSPLKKKVTEAIKPRTETTPLRQKPQETETTPNKNLYKRMEDKSPAPKKSKPPTPQMLKSEPAAQPEKVKYNTSTL